MLPPSGLITLALALALGLGICPSVLAEAPRQLPLNRYARLWTDSRFTTKPVVISPGIGPGPLDEWALGGISEVNDGFLLILFNRTNPQEKRIIQPGNSGGFEIRQVRRVPNNYLATEVELSYKNQTGWVRYEESMLALKPAPVQRPQGRQEGQRDPRDPRDPRSNGNDNSNGRDSRAQPQAPVAPTQQSGGERRSRERVMPTAPSSSQRR